MSAIKYIHAREILDSRGNPTIETDVITDNGTIGRASVPSGSSTGENEAMELRDRDKKRYCGKGVLDAVYNVNKRIAPTIIGIDVTNQTEIDKMMITTDGSSKKSSLGANAILSVSLAVARAAANTLRMPLYKYLGGVNAKVLPIPMMNIINGGSHSDAPIAFQEFMIRPIGMTSFSDGLQAGAEIFHVLKSILKKKGLSTSVGDEGGFAPNFSTIEEAIETIIAAIDRADYKVGSEITIGLDCAASEFYNNNLYDYSIFQKADSPKLTSEEQVKYLKKLVEKYPIDSIEDGMAENDWNGWKLLTEQLGERCQLVGDDLFVTNVKFLRKGIENNCANAILIKINQIGTLTETFDAAMMAQRAGYATVVSHRSGETEDTTIADIALAINSGQIKTGSLSRSDRLSKYNRLLRIEEELGVTAEYGYNNAVRKHD